MRYSVYNYDTRNYDYYEGSGPHGAHAGKPSIASPDLTRTVTGNAALGATPEEASWNLPEDAVQVGSGDLPQGRIAIVKGIDLTKLALLAGGLYLAWRLVR